MKTLLFSHKFLFVALFCFYLVSCSEEDSTIDENSIENLLIEKSPWVFDYYELKEILEGENTDIAFLEEEVNIGFNNDKLIFYKEGIGSSESSPGNVSTFAWKISNNTLIISSGTNLNDTEYIKNINVTQSEFTFESEWGYYDENSGNITRHSGTYYFK